MKAPPKLNLFEVAKLITEIRIIITHLQSQNLHEHYNMKTIFMVALSQYDSKHNSDDYYRDYVREVLGYPGELIDAALELIIEPEYIQDIKNVLYEKAPAL